MVNSGSVGEFMTSIISDDALRGQQNRIISAMRKASTPAPGQDLRDISQSLMMQSSGQGNYFDTMRKLNDLKNQTSINAEAGIYSQMKEMAARGDADAMAVNKAVDDVAGGDPKIAAALADKLHNDPEPINRLNAQMKVMKFANELGITPLSVQKERASINRLNIDAARAAAGGDEPALIKTTKAYMTASPEERAIMDKFAKVYEKNTYMDQSGNIAPIPGSPEATKVLAKAKAAGGATGKSNAEFVAQAQQNLPSVLDSAEFINSQIDELVNHPAKKYSVGAASLVPVLPGTPQADFKARIKQIEGGAFLQAYETLRGAGQITEVEGEKATAAKNRMRTSQSIKEFDKAANDYKSIIKQASKRAIDAARGNTVGEENVTNNINNTPTKRLKYNPTTGEFE